MLDSCFVNRLVEKQLDEEDVEAAVENRKEGIEEVEPGPLAFRTWKERDCPSEHGKDKVEEETKAKETDIESVAM